ncbi:class I SAM-dependent methyltransferase [archaeon]
MDFLEAKENLLDKLVSETSDESLRKLPESSIITIIENVFFPHMPYRPKERSEEGGALQLLAQKLPKKKTYSLTELAKRGIEPDERLEIGGKEQEEGSKIIKRGRKAVVRLEKALAPEALDFYAAYFSGHQSPTVDVHLHDYPEENASALHVGVGLSGIELMKQLQEKKDSGIKLYLLDNDPLVCSVLNRFKEMNNVEGVEIIKSDLVDMPFEKETFDHVHADRVFHHVEVDQLGAAVAEVHRVMKPGATLHVQDVLDAHKPVFDHDKFKEHSKGKFSTTSKEYSDGITLSGKNQKTIHLELHRL